VSAQQFPREAWNASQPPARIFANVYYVGPRGVSAILITSDEGHVLIDGGLPESVPGIVSSIRTLGFRIEDVRLILNSHVHFDHAGGIGELQTLSGARVAASAASARVLRSGRSGPDDPQFGVIPPIDPVGTVQVVSDGETLRVGPLSLTAHATGGHTPGGTSWTWQSCQDDRCLNLVYADSLNAISADAFRFTSSQAYPTALADFERGFATLSAVPCDILLTPHADASDLWTRLSRRDQGGGVDALVDRTACRRYVDAARGRLAARIAAEKRQP
jgi:metallo-beta-lactamase class B